MYNNEPTIIQQHLLREAVDNFNCCCEILPRKALREIKYFFHVRFMKIRILKCLSETCGEENQATLIFQLIS